MVGGEPYLGRGDGRDERGEGRRVVSSEGGDEPQGAGVYPERRERKRGGDEREGGERCREGRFEDRRVGGEVPGQLGGGAEDGRGEGGGKIRAARHGWRG